MPAHPHAGAMRDEAFGMVAVLELGQACVRNCRQML